MGGGYTGRLMVVDLSRSEIAVEEYPQSFADDYLGGFGVNNRLFRDYSNHGTESFSLCHLFGHGNNCLMIAPRKFDTIGIRFCNNTVLITLDSKGHNRSTRNGVQSVTVA